MNLFGLSPVQSKEQFSQRAFIILLKQQRDHLCQYFPLLKGNEMVNIFNNSESCNMANLQRVILWTFLAMVSGLIFAESMWPASIEKGHGTRAPKLFTKLAVSNVYTKVL